MTEKETRAVRRTRDEKRAKTDKPYPINIQQRGSSDSENAWPFTGPKAPRDKLENPCWKEFSPNLREERQESCPSTEEGKQTESEGKGGNNSVSKIAKAHNIQSDLWRRAGEGEKQNCSSNTHKILCSRCRKTKADSYREDKSKGPTKECEQKVQYK